MRLICSLALALLLVASASSAAPIIDNFRKIQVDNGLNPETTTFNTTANNWIVCGGTDYNLQVTGVTQSAGSGIGTWSQAGSTLAGTNARVRVHYAKVNSGETGVKLRIETASNTYLSWWCYEIRNLAASSPLDQTAGQTFSSTTTPSSGSTSTRTEANQILIGFLGTNSAGNQDFDPGIPSGWTLPNISSVVGSEESATHAVGVTMYKIVSATGTDAFAPTLSASASGAVIVVGFKDVSQPSADEGDDAIVITF